MINLHVNNRTMNLLEENIREYLQDLGGEHHFLKQTQKSLTIKNKIIN